MLFCFFFPQKTKNIQYLVSVPSTQSNLRCLALAVSAGKPVLLEGAVGCGKTALVEHLAHVTARSATPQIMKIQLGDQTDSKVRLGYETSSCDYGVRHFETNNQYLKCL